MDNNHTVDIFNIPLALQLEVWGSWLTITDVAKMDSAICLREVRPLFLELISREDLVIINRDIAKANIVSLMTWIVARKVNINQCYLSKAVAPAVYIPFFTVISKRLEKLTITSQGEDEMAFPAMLGCAGAFCTNIKEISLKKCLSVRGLENILWTSQKTVINLSIENCNLAGFEVIDFNLPSLLFLHIKECKNMSSTTLKQLLHDVLNLEILILWQVRAWVADLEFAQHLRMVSIDASNITDAAFCSLVHSCPLLEIVQLRNCVSLTDTSMIELLQHAKCLSALYLSSNSNFTDATLETIAMHCGERLRHLSIFNCVAITDTGLNQISEACHGLLGLGIGGRNMVFISTITIQALLQANPLLQEARLGWGIVEQDTDDVLTTLASNCPHVRYLDIYHLKGFTEIGIAAISLSCTQLHTVVVDPKCTIINPLSRYFWQIDRCPGLKFLFESVWLYYWCEKFYQICI